MQKAYTTLEVWQKSRELVTIIYQLTGSFPKEELFGLTSQIRRSAVSVPSNIAEGCGRNTSKDTLQFLLIARGSLYELETQLYLALDLKYLEEIKFNEVLPQLTTCKKLPNGFINYFQQLPTNN